MDVDDWSALQKAYEAAVDEFEPVSRALTAILLERNGLDPKYRALLAAEASARDAVIAARMRLLHFWRVTRAGPRPALDSARQHNSHAI
jgi:hypothetical protein